MGFAADISKQVRKDTSFHFVYPPGVPVALGDIMVRDAGIWVPVGNLADEFDIEIESVQDTTPDNWSPSSEHGFDFAVKASGEPSTAFKVLTKAQAGVKIDLTGDSSFVLSLAGVTFTRMKSVKGFWAKLREAQPKWTWDLRRRFVTRIVQADSGTFIASATGGASFELEADSDVKIASFTVADLAAGFTMKSTMSAKDQFTGKGPITPLFSAHRLRLIGGVGPAARAVSEIELIEPEDEEDSGDTE
jgi:hypothetical protein